MSEVAKTNQLPTLSELFSDVANVGQYEALNTLLNAEPPKAWVKEHPYISGFKYLPIDKVEHLLKRIFKRHRIEVLREGTAFNGVYVVVRLHYLDPISGEMNWQDGVGAAQLQTKKGTSAADLVNINNGAISMAFPIAKTLAVKDAAGQIGKVFGADLNRKDVLEFKPDVELINKSREEKRKELLENAK